MRIDTSSIQGLLTREIKPELERLKKATQGIESLFVKDLLKIMHKSAEATKLAKGPGTEIYQDMMDQALADSVSKNGSFGLAKSLYNQFEPLLRAQAAKQPSSKSHTEEGK